MHFINPVTCRFAEIQLPSIRYQVDFVGAGRKGLDNDGALVSSHETTLRVKSAAIRNKLWICESADGKGVGREDMNLWSVDLTTSVR